MNPTVQNPEIRGALMQARGELRKSKYLAPGAVRL